MSYFFFSAPGGGSGSAGTLAQTLDLGNVTGGTDIIVSSTDQISMGQAKLIPNYASGPGYAVTMPLGAGRLAIQSELPNTPSWQATLAVNPRALVPAETNSYFIFRKQAGLSLENEITLRPSFPFPAIPHTVEIPDKDGIIAMSADITLPLALANDNKTGGNEIEVQDSDKIFFAAANSSGISQKGIKIIGYQGATAAALFELYLQEKNDFLAVLSDIPAWSTVNSAPLGTGYSGYIYFQYNTKQVIVTANVTRSGGSIVSGTMPIGLRPSVPVYEIIRTSFSGTLSVNYCRIDTDGTVNIYTSTGTVIISGTNATVQTTYNIP